MHGGYATPRRYPPGLAHRPQVVRAYDRNGNIAGGILASDGERSWPSSGPAPIP
ncbi:MAG TPA: hypothetical protein VF933_21915 [Streptosporangiaceae bacterium]